MVSFINGSGTIKVIQNPKTKIFVAFYDNNRGIIAQGKTTDEAISKCQSHNESYIKYTRI